MSQRFTLNSQDLKKISTGAIVAIVGALLVYATDLVPQIDWGVYTPLVTAVFAVLANVVRKWLAENK